MANHRSALKRARQNEVRRIRNRSVKTRVKNVVKEIYTNAEGQSGVASEQIQHAQSVIDKAAKKGVIHQRTASRKISRLAKKINSVNPTT